MGFICEIIKKELTEIIYFKKSLFFSIISILICIYLSLTTDSLINNTDNSCYLLSIIMSLAQGLQFMTDSILSDKRNQTLEVMIVAEKINSVFFAKMITTVILCSVPFIIYYCFFAVTGLNILYSKSLFFNTLLFFWLGGCLVAIIVIFFNDEKNVAIPAVFILFLFVGLVKAMFIFNERYSETLGTILLSFLAVFVTLIAILFYKNTKMYLKNL